MDAKNRLINTDTLEFPVGGPSGSTEATTPATPSLPAVPFAWTLPLANLVPPAKPRRPLRWAAARPACADGCQNLERDPPLSVIRPSVSKYLTFDEIDFPAKARPTNATDVVALASSIRAIGLQNPPTVIERAGRYLLIAGRHRLEALRVLGEERVPFRVVDFSDVECRLWTISENLHRTELHPVHRAEQIAEFARLVKERQTAQVAHPHGAEEMQKSAREAFGLGNPAQLEPVSKGGRGLEGGGSEGGQLAHPERYEQRGVSLAARELGITREEVRRSQAIAALPDEVKAKAVELGRGGSQAALLRAAKAPTPQAQVEALDRRATTEPTAKPLRDLEYLAAGEFARWIKITTPNNRLHVIRMIRQCADILEDELDGIADGPHANDVDEEGRRYGQ